MLDDEISNCSLSVCVAADSETRREKKQEKLSQSSRGAINTYVEVSKIQ